MSFSRKSWAFVRKDLQTALSYRLAFFAQLVFVFFMVAAFYFFSRMFEGLTIKTLAPYGGSYFPFVLAFKRADPSSWLVQGLSYLLGGVYYPVAVLPDWGQWLANILPITHALEAMRKLLLLGAPLSEVTASILGLLIFSVVAGPLSVGSFLLALRRVKRDGSLSHF